MDGRLIFLHHSGRLKAVRTLAWKGIGLLDWPSRKGEGIYDPEVPGRTAKKSRLRTNAVPVLKLTQVGEMNILRRSRERS